VQKGRQVGGNGEGRPYRRPEVQAAFGADVELPGLKGNGDGQAAEDDGRGGFDQVEEAAPGEERPEQERR
jgi:hypothetical protein